MLDKNQTPLQPCSPARARKLLNKGRAVVARHTPFTIRLKDRTVAKSQVDTKSHTLDAIAVGKAEATTQTVPRVLVVGCSGRGSYARTRTDKHGFPRLRPPRTKDFFELVTGDLVRAVVAQGKWAETHTGRVAVRSSGSHTVTAPAGAVKTSYKNLRLLQRAGGYSYTWKEEGVSSPA